MNFVSCMKHFDSKIYWFICCPPLANDNQVQKYRFSLLMNPQFDGNIIYANLSIQLIQLINQLPMT